MSHRQTYIKVNLQMEMTGWFGNGAEDEKQASLLEAGVQSSGVHIDHRHITLKEELGAGAFGVVYKAIWKGTVVAVKKLSIDDGSIKQDVMREFGAEASVMAELRHPNIVNFMGVVLHPEFVGLMMEFCPKGTLYNIIHEGNFTTMDWSLMLRLLIDSACGMNFLHQHVPAIVHRDLKSLNLLVSADWRGKVADFGLSALKEMVDPGADTAKKEPTAGVVGSLVWCAPEVRTEIFCSGMSLID
jgi:Janus kinase 2